MNEENFGSSLDALQEIRRVMQKSSRFISLSGWSGVWAGCSALGGLAAIWWLFSRYYQDYEIYGYHPYNFAVLRTRLILIAAAVLVSAIAGAVFFTFRKMKYKWSEAWNMTSRQFLFSLALPLLAGAFFILAFMIYNETRFIAPACLIFYGLALINAGKFSFSEIHYLGLLEITLGCLSLFIAGSDLYFLAIGFGFLHIIYGLIVWNKYDRTRQEE